jgi:hypothetical protein
MQLVLLQHGHGARAQLVLPQQERQQVGRAGGTPGLAPLPGVRFRLQFGYVSSSTISTACV